MKPTPKLSIVIVNWNSLAYLRECLQSITSSNDSQNFEIIVVDNSSTADETIGMRAEFPQVIAIRSEENLGFARANNLGVLSASAPHILFLNPDTKFLGDAIATMLERLSSTPGVAILGCKLLNTDGTIQTSCIQRFPTVLNQCLDLEFLRSRWPLWKIWGIAPLFSDSPELAKVEVVSGACLMITRQAFDRVGGFSPRYFMYAEDVDLCYHVRKAGWKVCYTGDASMIHHGGGTSRPGKGNAWVAIMQRQAILRFCRIAHGRLYALAYRAATGLNALLRLLVLAALFPIRRFAAEKKMVHSTPDKWISILKWSLGFDRRAAKLYGNV